ncbi:MAG: hypothetical protein RI894_1189 [Bacteroidota bacterium]|jgi:tetratricopeptide (TPR) repeat protein
MKKIVFSLFIILLMIKNGISQAPLVLKPAKKAETPEKKEEINEKKDSFTVKTTKVNHKKVVSAVNTPPMGGELYNEALVFYKNNEFKAALAKAQQASMTGIGADAFYLIALCHKKLDSDKNTLQHAYEAVLLADPSHFDALTQLGILHFNQKEFSDAVIYFEKALVIIPSDKELKGYLENAKKAEARSLKGKAVHFHNEKEKKETKNEAINPLKDEEYIKIYNQGVTALNNLNYDVAATSFEKAIKLAPKDAKTYFFLAKALANIPGESEQAAKYARKAGSLNETDGKLQYEIGNVYFLLTAKDETIAAYKRAYKLGFRDADLYQQLGIAFFYNKEEEEAIKWFEQAVVETPDDAALRYNLGTAYLSASKLDHAEQAFKKTIELDPKNKEAYYNYGKTLLQQNKQAEALEIAKTCMAIDIDYAKAYMIAAESSKRLGNEKEYARYLQRAKALDPKVLTIFQH